MTPLERCNSPDLPVPASLVAGPTIEERTVAYVAAIAAITAAAGVLRAVLLDHPMRYDEAFTFLFFAQSSDPAAWFKYLAPNNHVLHTLGVHAAIRIGGVQPWVIRAPAFLAGVALVPAAAWFAVQLTGRRLAGLCAAALVGASSLLIEYSVNARGYSLVCLAAVAMGIATGAICRDARRKAPWIAWIALAAVGMFTIPIMLYPIAIYALLILLQALVGPGRGKVRGLAVRRLALALCAAGGATIVLYLPVMHVSGLGAVLFNEYLRPVAIGEVLNRLPEVAAAALRHWTRDTSILWEVLVGGGVLAAGVQAVRRRRLLLGLPALSAIVLGAAALAHRVVPFPRVWLFLLPLVLVCAACGLGELAERFSPRRARWAGAVSLGLILTVAVWHSAARTLARPFLISEDLRTLVDADAVARDLVELYDGRTAVASQVPAFPSLEYYSLLHSRRPFIYYLDPRWPRVLIVVGSEQTLEGVLGANPGLAEYYHRPRLWRTYPRAKVYLTERKSPAAVR